MSTPLLIIRHAKRSGADTLDLSGHDLKELPKELLGLGSSLEVLNLSNNKLTSLSGLHELTNLRDINVSGNLIKKLPNDLLKCTKLRNLGLDKNPILADYPYLKKLAPADIEEALNKYFAELEYEEEASAEKTDPKIAKEEDKDDPSSMTEEQLRKAVTELKTELKGLKNLQDMNRPKSAMVIKVEEQKKEFLSANLDKELESEKVKTKKLEQQIDMLKNQLTKVMAEKSFGSGSTLEGIQGVTEIDYSELKIEEEIGKGGFATIYKGKWRGTTVAIKRLFDPNVTEAQMEEVRNEIIMMATLRHPKITLLLGICRKPPNICIVMECCKTSLFSLLHKSTYFSLRLTKNRIDLQMNIRLRIARDVASVYSFIHSAGIVHRDLKSHNILLADNYQIRLCDFGLAKYKSDLNKGTMQYSGTPAYMALELFQKKSYDEKIDIFAFGTFLWELTSRQVPYEGLEPDMIKKKLLESPALSVPYNSPPEVTALITACRANPPEKRPSFEQIVDILEKIAN